MSSTVSRRAMLAGSGVMAASLATGVAMARVLPSAMVPLIGPGYQPVDVDERGLWQQYARVEEEIAGSNLLIKDPALTIYLRDLIGKVGGPAAKDMRIYLARIPDFNAIMFPTGFTVIFTGLLLRMRNEAQLAGVIAHESGHFLRKHQIRQWRDMRRKTDIFSILAVGAGVAGAGAGVYTGDLARLGAVDARQAGADAVPARLDRMAGDALGERGGASRGARAVRLGRRRCLPFVCRSAGEQQQGGATGGDGGAAIHGSPVRRTSRTPLYPLARRSCQNSSGLAFSSS